MSNYTVEIKPAVFYPTIIKFSDGSTVSATFDFSRCAKDKHMLAIMLIQRMFFHNSMSHKPEKSEGLFIKLMRLLDFRGSKK